MTPKRNYLKITATVKAMHKSALAIFYIARGGNRPLLGCDTAIELKLTKVAFSAVNKQLAVCMAPSYSHGKHEDLFTGVEILKSVKRVLHIRGMNHYRCQPFQESLGVKSVLIIVVPILLESTS